MLYTEINPELSDLVRASRDDNANISSAVPNNPEQPSITHAIWRQTEPTHGHPPPASQVRQLDRQTDNYSLNKNINGFQCNGKTFAYWCMSLVSFWDLPVTFYFAFKISCSVTLSTMTKPVPVKLVVVLCGCETWSW